MNAKPAVAQQIDVTDVSVVTVDAITMKDVDLIAGTLCSGRDHSGHLRIFHLDGRRNPFVGTVSRWQGGFRARVKDEAGQFQSHGPYPAEDAAETAMLEALAEYIRQHRHARGR